LSHGAVPPLHPGHGAGGAPPARSLIHLEQRERHPTLARIDRAFTCMSWCEFYPHHRLCAFSSRCSDHTPLLLHTNVDAPTTKRFRFEAIWPKFLGYLNAVKEGWRNTLQNANTCRILDFKLGNTAKSFKRWSQKFVGSVRLQLAVANEVVFHLD
jgi:hypothetical protein